MEHAWVDVYTHFTSRGLNFDRMCLILFSARQWVYHDCCMIEDKITKNSFTTRILIDARVM